MAGVGRSLIQVQQIEEKKHMSLRFHKHRGREKRKKRMEIGK